MRGVSRAELADSESVDELLDEGNAFEAGAVAGVEEADNEDEREVHTHEFPEDDVPEEYLDKDLRNVATKDEWELGRHPAFGDDTVRPATRAPTLNTMGRSRIRSATMYITSFPSANAHIPDEAFWRSMISATEIPVVTDSYRIVRVRLRTIA